jgi:3-oxoacyl-(acyl-carrier-protein) synthase
MGGDPTVEPFSWGNSSRLTVELIHLALGSADPSNVRLVVASGNGSPSLDAMEARAIQEVFGPSGTDVIAPKALLGEFDGNAILRLTLALSDLQRTRGPQAVSQIDNSTKTQSCCFQSPKGDIVLLLGASTGGGRAALSFILP